MKKIFIITIIFVGLMPLAFGEVFIQNDQQYIGDDDALHIVGEIINNLEVPLNQINVHVTLLDEDGHPIVTKETNSLLNIIMPGMKSPFDLVLTDYEVKKTKSYSLELDYKVSPPKKSGHRHY